MKSTKFLLILILTVSILRAQAPLPGPTSDCERCKENPTLEFKGPANTTNVLDNFCKTFQVMRPPSGNCQITVCYKKRICEGKVDIKIESIVNNCDDRDAIYVYRQAWAALWRDDDPWDVMPDNLGEGISLRIYSPCCWKWSDACTRGPFGGGPGSAWMLEPCHAVPPNRDPACCVQTFNSIVYTTDPTNCCRFVAKGISESCNNYITGKVCGQDTPCPQSEFYPCVFMCNIMSGQVTDVNSSIINCGRFFERP